MKRARKMPWGWILAGAAAAWLLFKPKAAAASSTPGTVTIAPGSMGVINSGGQNVTLVLPAGATWESEIVGLNGRSVPMGGSAPLLQFPNAGNFTFTWVTSQGITQTTTMEIQ